MVRSNGDRATTLISDKLFIAADNMLLFSSLNTDL